jgi:hypothetical protein
VGYAAQCGRVRRPPSSAAGLITRDHGRKHPSIDGAHRHAELGLNASHASHCRPSSSAVQRRTTTSAAAPSEIVEAAAAVMVPSRVNAARARRAGCARAGRPVHRVLRGRCARRLVRAAQHRIPGPNRPRTGLLRRGAGGSPGRTHRLSPAVQALGRALLDLERASRAGRRGSTSDVVLIDRVDH